MCLGGGGGKPAVSEDEKQAKENQDAEEARKKAKAKEEQLEKTAKAKTLGGGASRRSLLTGSKGGLGFYDETL